MYANALVTGCAGFIGSHLCEALTAKGWRVIGIDGFLDNYSKRVKERNIYSLLKHNNFRFIKGDLMRVPLENITKNIDYIFHLAGQPGVRDSWGGRFDSYVTNNILATQRLLEAVKENDIKKFVYASSSSVYGNTGSLPISEFSLPIPFSPYGVTKLAAENLCSLYYENYGVPTVSLRYFTVYGPRQRPDMSITSFINAILRGRPIAVYGDGTQKRDFTYIDDVVAATVLAAQKPVIGEVFNVGSGYPVALMEVVRMLEELIGEKARIEFIRSQKGDVKDTFANTAKISEMLEFRSLFELDKGLSRQIEYMGKYIGRR